MEQKRLDLSRTVYELTTEYPELIDALIYVGFTEIGTPGMLNTAGRFMTIPKGVALRRKDLSEVRAALAGAGFETYWSTGEPEL